MIFKTTTTTAPTIIPVNEPLLRPPPPAPLLPPPLALATAVLDTTDPVSTGEVVPPAIAPTLLLFAGNAAVPTVPLNR